MKIPRQRIYKTYFLSSYIKALFKSEVENSKRYLNAFFLSRFGAAPLYVGRARVGIMLSVKYALQKNRDQKKVCLMSPLTILDLVNMVSHSGATPEFYDLNGKTLSLDSFFLRKRLSFGDVSSVVITHYYGVQRDITEIKAICDEFGVVLIEDCAISIGASILGKNVGTYGELSVFSFSLFKFLNFFWGGVVICNSESSKAFLDSEILNWPQLNFAAYWGQLLKYIKFGLVTESYFYYFIFYIFRFGLKNNISFVTKNIQNDPYVPYSGSIDDTCFSKPANAFYVELHNKVSSVFSELESRRIKAFYIYKNIIFPEVVCLPENFVFAESSMINFPLIFSNSEHRNFIANKLLDLGFDCSKQLYRNIHDVEGYNNIVGNSNGVTDIVGRCLFLPIHRGVSFKHICEMMPKLNNALKEMLVDK
jgi:perosamine synthetase